MKRTFSEYAAFFQQFRERFETTGAIAPSSRFLARAMLGPLRKAHSRPVRILEVGPGTGAVTRSLVREIRDGDVLDLVELNDHFVDLLNHRFEHDAEFRHASAIATVHRCAIQEFEPGAPYDFIISGLPLNNFTPELVKDILDSLFEYLSPGGTVSYFEYMYIRYLKRRLLTGESRSRLQALDRILKDFQQRYRIRRDWVFPNVPPAWVQHLQKPADAVATGI